MTDTLHIAICEDLPQEREKLLAILEENKIHTETDIFICGEDFLNDFQAGKYDLILMPSI